MTTRVWGRTAAGRGRARRWRAAVATAATDQPPTAAASSSMAVRPRDSPIFAAVAAKIGTVPVSGRRQPRRGGQRRQAKAQEHRGRVEAGVAVVEPLQHVQQQFALARLKEAEVREDGGIGEGHGAAFSVAGRPGLDEGPHAHPRAMLRNGMVIVHVVVGRHAPQAGLEDRRAAAAPARIDRAGDGEVEPRHVGDRRMGRGRRLVVLVVGRARRAEQQVVAESETEAAGDVVHVGGGAIDVGMIADQEQPAAAGDEADHGVGLLRRVADRGEFDHQARRSRPGWRRRSCRTPATATW